MKHTCHPERKVWFAKRSKLGVEGSRQRRRFRCRIREFSPRTRQRRENAWRASVLLPELRGSFDCARLRFANSRSAQDDIVWNVAHRHS